MRYLAVFGDILGMFSKGRKIELILVKENWKTGGVQLFILHFSD